MREKEGARKKEHEIGRGWDRATGKRVESKGKKVGQRGSKLKKYRIKLYFSGSWHKIKT